MKCNYITEQLYYNKPNYCKFCNTLLPYEKRRNKFCNKSCSSKETNKLRLEKESIEYKCQICNSKFKKRYKINNSIIKCNSCKRKEYNVKYNAKSKQKLVSIKQVSKRTITKILKRMNVGCSSCGWKDCVCDLHHIISKKKGGTDLHNNLTYLCPNCHRKLHNELDVKFKSFLDQVGDKWIEFYNI